MEEEDEDEEVGSSEVGSSGKASLSGKVVLVLLAFEAGAVKEGSGFLPSRQMRVGQVWGSLHTYRQIRSGFAPCLAGRSSQSVDRVAVRCWRRVGLTKVWR